MSVIRIKSVAKISLMNISCTPIITIRMILPWKGITIPNSWYSAVNHLPAFSTLPGKFWENHIFIWVLLLVFLSARLYKKGISRHTSAGLGVYQFGTRHDCWKRFLDFNYFILYIYLIIFILFKNYKRYEDILSQSNNGICLSCYTFVVHKYKLTLTLIPSHTHSCTLPIKLQLHVPLMS